MLRFGISGTNWTGKSTTIHDFAQRYCDRNVDIVSLSDLVRKSPFPMVDLQTPDGSRWMIEQVTAILDRPGDADIQFFDRSPLDILAFTQYAFDRERQEPDAALLSRVVDLAGHFDTIFFCGPSEPWPVGVSPSNIDLAFALLMDRYLRQAIDRFEVSIVELPWDLDERRTVLAQHMRA